MKDQINISGLNKYKGNVKFKKILKKMESVNICCQPNCGASQPIIRFSAMEENVYKIYIDSDKNKTIVDITVGEIKKIFENLSNEDVEIMGFDPSLIHPRNFVFTNFPVLPSCDRPYVKKDGCICDDDFTNAYNDLIKINKRFLEPNITEALFQKAYQSMKFKISTMYNNSKSRAKYSNGRPIKSFKERIGGKEGIVRSSIQGKRGDKTGRTVIGPDPTIKMGQLALPYEMASGLTIPERVSNFNFAEMQKLVNSGKVGSLLSPDGDTRINLKRYRHGTILIPGDIIKRNNSDILVISGRELVEPGDIILRNGEIIDSTVANRDYTLKPGWIVERHLKNGDCVLLGRQPTLHRQSTQAMEVVLRPGKTLRFSLSITAGFNADFDGDEMNIYVPQSLEAQAELKLLSAAKYNMMSSQSSKTIVKIVQDALLGAYRMTLGKHPIEKGKFFDICMVINKTSAEILSTINHIRKVLHKFGKKTQCFNGHGLVSMILPRDFNYQKKNSANVNEPVVKIYKGVMYEGTLDKSIIGSAHNSIIQTLHKEYDEDVASQFVDNIQFVANKWLQNTGFSVGLKDCLLPKTTGVNKEQEIKDIIQKCFIEAEGIKNTTTHPSIRELRINAALGKAKDIGLKIAKESLAKDNNFLSTVRSGSKGDFFNIAQITGILGQQNLKGQRIPLTMNHGKRSLPHYPFGELPVEMEYESRGFIANSFINGLNPRQFYMHAMAAREGVTDTATGTATSGYMQRQIVKLLEDIKIQYDGTVRDVTGRIFQMAYGDDGFDPTQTIKVKNNQEAIDIFRLVDRLNMKYE